MIASAQQRPIWFQLVDAQFSPFMGAMVDMVELADGATVAHFRNALEAKYANSHLQGVPSSNIPVYAIKATLDDVDKVLLRSGLTLIGLGTTDDEPLLVVVPPPIANKRLSNRVLSFHIDAVLQK
jgi:hypothetical protein